MGKTLEGRVKLKRDTSANWTINNPVILNGELILVDTAEGELRTKIGDGTKTYTQLPFSDEILRNLINNKASTTDIKNYVDPIIAALGYEDVGIYVSDTEPMGAVDGDIWFDLSSEPVSNGDGVSY